MTNPFADHLEQIIPARMQALNIPGAAVALIENGDIAFVRGYGLADAEVRSPVTPDTLFSLQSISKSLAAWGIMKLVERGEIGLDVPIGEYLARWQLPPSPYDAGEVTLRRLLSHHAGISTAGFPGIAPEYDVPTLVDGLNGQLPPLNDEQKRYWKLWDLSTDWPVKLAFRPGEAFHYSNPGFGLLELAIEDVTGQSYSAYTEESILHPLGLRNSSFSTDDGRVYAKPYGAGMKRVRTYRYLSKAAGGLYATIGDLAKFACAEMSGPRGEPPGRGVISQRSVASMFESQGLADKTDEIQFESGLGHFIFGAGAAMNVHHSGGSLGWRSIYSIFPNLGMGFCMLVNSDEGNPLWLPLIREWREMVARQA